jgi:hypothetical protein
MADVIDESTWPCQVEGSKTFCATKVMLPAGVASVEWRNTGMAAQASYGEAGVPGSVGNGVHVALSAVAGRRSSVEDGTIDAIHEVRLPRWLGSIARLPLSFERWNFAPTFASIGS